MKQPYRNQSLLVIVMLFITTLSYSQIPNDSPYPVDFIVTDANGNESTYEYSSMVDFGITLSQTVTAELEWARDDGAYDADGDGVPDPDYRDSLNCSWGNTMPMAGKMALIRRGACFFSQKILNAQNAGAVGAIICNNAPDEALVNMLGIDSAALVNIPAVFVSFEDCELIRGGIDNGSSTTASFKVNTFYNNFGPFAYGTPINHSIPLNLIQVNLLNTETTSVMNTSLSVDITDPSGAVTTLTEIVDTIASLEDRVVGFEDYLPSTIGTYTMSFGNSLSSDVLETTFKITDHTWHMDNEDIVDWVANTDAGFIEDGLRYDMGNTYLTGTEAGVAVAATFMLENAAALFTGDADSDRFQIRLYDMDPDGDGEGPDVSETDYSSFQVVGFADYSLTGNEAAYEEIVVTFDDPAILKADGQYALMIQYDGVNAGLGIPPHYAYGGTDPYPYFGTFVFTDQLYLGGWNGDFRGVVRLQTDMFVPLSDANVVLEAEKLKVYPNPTNDYMNLSIDLAENADEVQIGILDMMGKVVQTRTLNNVKNEVTLFNVSALSSGTYFMSVVTPEGYRSVKFSVIK